ncbi:MAG: diguanylate cyclase, partial [Clostridia bacterium]
MKRFFKISIQFASVGFFLLIAWAMLLSRGFACGSFALFEIELLIVALAFCWRFDTKKLLKSTSLYFRQGYQKNAYNNKIHNNRSLPFCESIKHVKFSEAVAENSEKYVKSEKEKNVAAFSRKETVIYEYNLTKNIPETKESELYGEFGRLNCGFNERNVLWANFNVHPDEQKKYIKIMNSDNLISDFMNGISSYDFDFRLMVQNSAPEWMNLNVKTIKYSDSSDIKAFFIIKNINEKKQKEFEIERKSELDVLTDVFNRTAIIEKIQSIFKNEPLSQHALIMFDIDNFKHINDTYGHIFGDKILS